MATLDRGTERRLAAIIGLVLGTVLLSGAAALAQSHTPTSRPAAQPGQLLSGVDIVPPTPVEITFARPQAPTRPAAPAGVQRPPVATLPGGMRVAAMTSYDPNCSGAGWRERRGQAALASLRHPVPTGVSLSFLAGGGALKGMTYYDRHHVDVYVGSCAAESTALLRHVVAHEMGHAWDSFHLTNALRADYLAARGLPAGTPWFGCNECQDFATPAGDFAETYAQWQRGSSESRSKLAAPASASQLAELGSRFFS